MSALDDILRIDRIIEERAARSDRLGIAVNAAVASGFSNERDIEAWVDASEAAFVAVRLVSAKRGRQRLRAMRRQLTRAAILAVDAPGWIRAALWLGKGVSKLFPFPFNVIVPAVLWTVERMIQADEATSNEDL